MAVSQASAQQWPIQLDRILTFGPVNWPSAVRWYALLSSVQTKLDSMHIEGRGVGARRLRSSWLFPMTEPWAWGLPLHTDSTGRGSTIVHFYQPDADGQQIFILKWILLNASWFFPIFIILRTIFTGVHRYLYVDTDYAFTEEEKKKRQQHQQFYTDFIKQLGQTRLQRVQDRLAFWWMNEFVC